MSASNEMTTTDAVRSMLLLMPKLVGRAKRLPIPAGWDRQGIGRRMFVFPEKSLDEQETTDLRRQLILGAAKRCFARNGFAGTTTKRVAAAAACMAEASGSSKRSRFFSSTSAARRAERGPRPGSLESCRMRDSISKPAM